MRRIGIVLVLAACNEGEVEPVALGEAVTGEALMGHLEALEAIGTANGDTRVSGTDGYDQSVDYVVSRLEEAGYDVELDPYETGSWSLESASLALGATTYTEGGGDLGFEVFPFSGSGDVTAQAVVVDVRVPPGAEGTSDSGCEAGDFDGFPQGAVAVLQRGSCTFASKVGNAIDAGAAAVLIFNEGQTGRTEPFAGSLGDQPVAVPVIAISYAAGAGIANADTPTTAHVVVDANGGVVTEYNVIAELAGADPDRVVMVGAHLDSVAAGPGINDNGSGTALVLETALQAAETGWEPANTVRFAWWGAEEQGLVGSWHWAYVEGTEEFDAERIDPLVAYLNYDMVASGNGYRFVYDGSSDGGGSAFEEVEEIYTSWFDARDMAYARTPLFIPTDSYWFVLAGVPTGGLYSGAYEPKAQGWAEEVGGEVGASLDDCYHQACDLVVNTNADLFADLGAAGAHAVQVLGDRPVDADVATRRLPTPARDLPRPSGCHDHVHWDR